MRNIVSYENYNEEVNEGMFRKFFTGHESAEERDEKMMEVMAAIQAAEDLVMANPSDYAQSNNWERTKQMLMNQAAENNYKGGIDIRPSASNGLLYVTYKEGISGLQALAGSVAFRRDNPLGKG
jgi:hypothetical protein